MKEHRDSIIKFPHFTPQARARWEQIPAWAQENILAAVWCGDCRSSRPMRPNEGSIKAGSLVLKGVCKHCGHPVVRSIEPED